MWSRPISILNRQTNTNTFCNCRVTPYILNEPFHSASLSDYDAYVLPTKASLYAPMNSSNTLTIVDTTSLFQRVHAIARIKLSQTTTSQPSRVLLVITYNPALRSISTIIQRHFKILSSSPRCNSVFQTTPLVAFRRPYKSYNLRDILVRSKLRTDEQTDVSKGSFRCGKNCITCCYITDGRTDYTFSATGEIRTIHDRIDCNSKISHLHDTLSTLQQNST